MINETEKMKQARHALQELTASDPAAASNMLRYVRALALMVAGRSGAGRQAGEPHIGAMFQLTEGEEILVMSLTVRSREEQIILAFDIDDAAGPPVGFGVVRLEGEMVLRRNCDLWSPANEGRAVIVPRDDFDGYLAFQRGGALRHVQGALPGNRDAGLRRGTARLNRLANSEAVRAVAGVGYRHLIRSEGSDGIFGETAPIAA